MAKNMRLVFPGATHLVAVLSSLPRLARLSLSGVGLRDEGVSVVGRGLREVRPPLQLSALSLASNDITATGTQALAPFLRSNPSLLELDLQVRVIVLVTVLSALILMFSFIGRCNIIRDNFPMSSLFRLF
jgi:Ran GTPase-activating protein (RanGAP) involved in mRNA processing and transport